MDINQVANYVIYNLMEFSHKLNPLKLQKLLYYIEAWYNAFYKKELFEGEEFEAWLHGPVNRTIYDRFKDRGMYDQIDRDDLPFNYDAEELADKIRSHIESVLEAYASMSAVQLEELTHNEGPWKKARKDAGTERSNEIISKKFMGDYYRRRINEKTAD